MIQTLSGTGACRAAGVFLARFSGASTIYISDPTWGNHLTIMAEVRNDDDVAYIERIVLRQATKSRITAMTTWGNQPPGTTIMAEAGLEVRSYRYFDAATNGLDYAGLREDIEAAPDGSAFLLHACAHNPTGVDPTDAQARSE